MDDKKISSRRRMFLTAATCGPVLAVAALATRQQEIAQQPATPAPAQPESGVGYHETDHIRKYYYTAAYF